MNDRKNTITASEIGTYVFCARAWALQKLGHPSSNRRMMEEGSEFHRRFGARDRLIRLLGVFILIGMLCLLYFIIRSFLK